MALASITAGGHKKPINKLNPAWCANVKTTNMLSATLATSPKPESSKILFGKFQLVVSKVFGTGCKDISSFHKTSLEACGHEC